MITDAVTPLLQSYVAQSAALAWFIAQLMKLVIELLRHGNLRWERMVGSGGFPSSHTSLVIALTTAIGLHQGTDSDLFVTSLIFSLVVMYDASGVRREAGRQAQILNQLMEHFRQRNITVHEGSRSLKELLGHTPFEVFGGVILGIAVAFMLYYGYQGDI